MQIKIILILLFLGAQLSMKAQSAIDFKFETGDLLFQDLDCGPLCDAIEKVTKGIDGKDFSHIGLVYIKNDSTYVIEAAGNDVHLTPLEKFLYRNVDDHGNPKIVIGRLKNPFRKLNKNALAFALKQIGTPYDDEYLYDNGKYYCSELIYDSYKFANGDKPFFELKPMTFKDPATGKTMKAWKDYYDQLGMPIPEGKPGCNPGGISQSNHLVMVKSFY